MSLCVFRPFIPCTPFGCYLAQPLTVIVSKGKHYTTMGGKIHRSSHWWDFTDLNSETGKALIIFSFTVPLFSSFSRGSYTACTKLVYF